MVTPILPPLLTQQTKRPLVSASNQMNGSQSPVSLMLLRRGNPHKKILTNPVSGNGLETSQDYL